MASLASVATLAHDEVFDVINRVGLYYEKGVSGNTFLTCRNPDFQPRFQGNLRH